MAKFLGIDTSCYTTSAAVYDSTEGIVRVTHYFICKGWKKRVIPVRNGIPACQKSPCDFGTIRAMD